jgi:hypothetical protein
MILATRNSSFVARRSQKEYISRGDAERAEGEKIEIDNIDGIIIDTLHAQFGLATQVWTLGTGFYTPPRLRDSA